WSFEPDPQRYGGNRRFAKASDATPEKYATKCLCRTNFFGYPVMGWRRQTDQRQEACSAPLSSTNPFIDDINKREDDRHSTASSSSRRRQQDWELHRIKFQIELNETKMQQMKLVCKQIDLKMEILKDEVEEGRFFR
ncbi:unnamed protein product, partial [Orchesella dallaii]